MYKPRVAPYRVVLFSDACLLAPPPLFRPPLLLLGEKAAPRTAIEKYIVSARPSPSWALAWPVWRPRRVLALSSPARSAALARDGEGVLTAYLVHYR